MIIGALVALMLVSSWVFSVFAIARPTRLLADRMRELADGNFDIVLLARQKDEIGAVAGSVEAFKVKAQEKARQESEAKAEQDRLTAEQRRADMHRLAGEFEAAVGEIVETVSSASTELEAAAGTLTQTADGTQRLATTVASASEEASASVQSVASATEELATSVSEIGRQIESSSNVAREAVRQAEQTDQRIHQLSEQATVIGDVVNPITTIAEQTTCWRPGRHHRGACWRPAAALRSLPGSEGTCGTDREGDERDQRADCPDPDRDRRLCDRDQGNRHHDRQHLADHSDDRGSGGRAGRAARRRSGQPAREGTSRVASNITEVNRGANETGSASAQVLSSAQSLSSDSNRLKLEVAKFLGCGARV